MSEAHNALASLMCALSDGDDIVVECRVPTTVGRDGITATDTCQVSDASHNGTITCRYQDGSTRNLRVSGGDLVFDEPASLAPPRVLAVQRIAPTLNIRIAETTHVRRVHFEPLVEDGEVVV